MRAEALLLGFALALFSSTASAQWGAWEADFDDGGKSWKEIQAKLPPPPKAQNLLLVERGGSGHRFFVDAASVSVGEDGVVRYTAVLKAAGGAVNVTFEGMRCETREMKLYAIGHPDGSWRRARDPQWQRIVRHVRPYRFLLYGDYFCPSAAVPTPARQAVDALRYGRSLAGTTASHE